MQSMTNTSKIILRFYFGIAAFFVLGSCATYRSALTQDLISPRPNNGNQREPSAAAIGTDTGSGAINKDHHHAQDLSLPQFDWPVDSARLTRGFLPYKKRPHLGIDLAATKNSPIFAAQRGVVIYAGHDFRGFGKMIIIENGYGWASLYAHFNKIYVAEGQKVIQGELLGAMGRTGRATGVHLHFEIRKEKSPIDPLPLLPHSDRVFKKVSMR